MLKEIRYQTEAVERMVQKVDNCLQDDVKEFLLEAPTGSGKTVMTGQFFTEYLARHADERIGFFWISPGKGDLAGQSKRSMGEKYPHLRSIALADLLVQRELKAGDICFINWEAINKKGNIATREGERENMFDALGSSRLDRFIIVVDESHETRNSLKAEELLESFGADMVIDITATPRENSRYDRMNTVTVPLADVIEAGFIKRQIILNEDLPSLDLTDVLQTALSKRDDIEQAYRAHNPNCQVPLILIQVENDKRIDTEYGKMSNAKAVQLKLESLGVPSDDIAVWTSHKDECQNLDDVKTSSVKVLIFKAAIATGYDIPRAHVLVKLRDVKSNVFNVQVLGRILRTQDKRHYDDDLVDSAYVYTEFDSAAYQLDLDEDTKEMLKEGRVKAQIKAEFKSNYPKFTIPMHRIDRTFGEKDDSQALHARLNEELSGEFINSLSISDDFKDRVVSGELETEGINDKAFFGGLGARDVAMANARITERMSRALNRFRKPYDMSSMIKSALKKHDTYNTSRDYNLLYLSNEDDIASRVQRAWDAYSEKRIEMSKGRVRYSPPDEIAYRGAKDEADTSRSYAYTREPDLDVKKTKSSTEALFADFLNADGNVMYWYKNESRGAHFGIPYRSPDGGGYAMYYPDFIILSKSRRLYIVDTKSPIKKNDSKDFKDTPAKYNAGRDYEAEFRSEIMQDAELSGLTVSMVKLEGGTFRICTANEYSTDYSDRFKWETLVIE